MSIFCGSPRLTNVPCVVKLLRLGRPTLLHPLLLSYVKKSVVSDVLPTYICGGYF